MLRRLGAIALHLLLGPLVGGAVFLALVLSARYVSSQELFLGGFAEVIPLIVAASYVLGVGPAALNVVAMAMLSRRLATRRERLRVAPLTGGLAAALGTSWIFFSEPRGAVHPAMVVMALAASGAAASLVCTALTERR